MDDDDDGLDGLEDEYPGWTFGVKWVTGNSAPDTRYLVAWRDGRPVSAQTVDGLRWQIQMAGG